MNSNSEAE
ncbi:unnamed protein product, partial [Allacma fusca]